LANPDLVPGTQALTKGIQVLRAISAEGRNTRFANLQARTGLPKPTLYRILKALMAEGLIRFEAKDSTYHLGLSFLRLAFQVLEELDIRDLAHEEMMRLSERTSEAIHLAVIEGFEAVYIDLVESNQPVGSVGRLGSSSALHAAASGKVIAAYLAPEALERLLGQLELPKLTKNTITSLKALRQEFAEIRDRGYAVNDEEETEGIQGVAAPVFNMAGEVVASIGISIPRFRYSSSKLKFYADSAMSTAKTISAKLGNLSEQPESGSSGRSSQAAQRRKSL
jgi:DNA-binding IclR family transcriptional regulator